MTIRLRPLLPLLLATWIATPALGQNNEAAPVATPRFPIQRFAVEGNTLVPATVVEQTLARFTGPSRDFADVQRALEALESLYRSRGFNTAYVSVPEQELEKGVVRLKVVEGKISKVSVEGNEHFSAENIRRSLPMLREGEAPNATRLSENVQLANQNPSKAVEVLLGVGQKEGDVNARIKVKDERPWRLTASLDNTGTIATGQHRLGIAFQHNNVFDSDHSFSAAYATAPHKPDGVKVDIYSLGYRIPLYSLGDSLEFVYAKSTVGVPSSSPSLAGGLGIVGKGNIFGIRYNWLMPRQGEYTSRLVFAFDARNMDSSCTAADGTKLTGVAGCEPYRVRPLSVTYQGAWQQENRAIGFGLGLSGNLSASSKESYDLASSGRGAPTGFLLWRANGSFVQVLPGDWQARLNGQAQFSSKPLVPTEQIGLAGSNAVRGFLERAIATDEGHFLQAELYTPELAGKLSLPGSLRALAFYDYGRGINHRAPPNSRFGISSAGIGLRYAYSKDISWRFDLANIINKHSPSSNADPIDSNWRGHFSLNVGF